MFTVGFVTDVHFGPPATFGGRLRKLTGQAPILLEQFVNTMNCDVQPDVVVNLGDVLEDESYPDDLKRYEAFCSILQKNHAPVVHVAGNHDLIHLQSQDLLAFWRTNNATLYRSFELGPFHWVVLHSQETKDVCISIDETQINWLESDLKKHSNTPTIVLVHHSLADQDLRGNRWFDKAPHICLIQERKKIRSLLEAHGHVRAVFNGHLHWNHLDVIRGIPYITLQSLIENIDDDAPGRAAFAYAVARFSEGALVVEVCGVERARYQFAY